MAAETAPHGRATQRPPAVNGEGQLDPCVLVLEGSIPNEKIKSEGYWAAMGTDEQTDQPITTSEWLSRLAPKAWAVQGLQFSELLV